MKEFLTKHKADIGLAVLVVYTLILAVLTANQLFHLGLFPTKLERLISESIEKFDSDDQEVRKRGYLEVVEYGDFAVPQLIDAMDREGPSRDLSIRALQQITDKNFKDPKEWREWYDKHHEQFLE